MTKAHIYGRVSTLDQANGHSIDIQIEQGKQLFESQLKPLGVSIGEVLRDEGQSAFTTPLFRRELGRKLCDAAIVKPRDHIIFTRYDRAFRSIGDFRDSVSLFNSRDITVHYVNAPFDLGTANGRIMATILVAMAEWESDMKSERLREEREYHRQQHPHIPSGNSFGKMPGLKPKKIAGKSAYERVHDEFETYLYFLRLCAEGKKAMYEIAEMCDEHLHNLRGMVFVKSKFRERQWPMDSGSRKIFAKQSFHQKTLAIFYGDREEFHLPVHPRFKHIRDRYEEYLTNRLSRLPSHRRKKGIGQVVF